MAAPACLTSVRTRRGTRSFFRIESITAPRTRRNAKAGNGSAREKSYRLAASTRPIIAVASRSSRVAGSTFRPMRRAIRRAIATLSMISCSRESSSRDRA